MRLILQLLEFDQSEFFGVAGKLISMDDTGYLYVPSGCQNKNKSTSMVFEMIDIL